MINLKRDNEQIKKENIVMKQQIATQQIMLKKMYTQNK